MPQFRSVGGAATNAIEQFLIQRELANRQAMLDDLERQQQASADEDRKRRIGLDERQFAAEQERLARLDQERVDQRDAASRQAGNVAGVRGMMADAMTQGPLTPDSAKTIGIMAFREGMDAPDEVQRILNPDLTTVETTGPNGPVRKAVTDEELRAGVPIPQEPAAPSRWQSAGPGVIFNPGNGEFRQVPGGTGADGATPGSTYSDERRTRIRDVIGEILGTPNGDGTFTDGMLTGSTTGVGSLTAMVPGTDARYLRAKLNTLKSGIAFSELTEMREASKTGGALGQVAIRELELLESALGAVDQGLRPEQLQSELQKILSSLDRWERAKAQGQAGPGARVGGAGGGGGMNMPSGGGDPLGLRGR